MWGKLGNSWFGHGKGGLRCRKYGKLQKTPQLCEEKSDCDSNLWTIVTFLVSHSNTILEVTAVVMEQLSSGRGGV